jgi:hypothetical protein
MAGQIGGFETEALDLGPSLPQDAEPSGDLDPNQLLDQDPAVVAEESADVNDAEAFLQGGAQESDVDKALDTAAEEEVEPEQAAAPPEEAPEKKESRAEKRIRELNQRAKQTAQRLEQERQQFEQERRQYQMQLQQMQAQQQAETQQSLQALRQYQEAQQRREWEAQERARYENMDPVSQVKYDAERRAAQLAETAAERKFRLLQEKLEGFEKAQQEANEERERQARFKVWKQETVAGRQSLFTGIDEKVAKEINVDFDEMIMGHAAGFGISPQQSAKQFKAALDKYVAARLAANNRAAVEKVKSKQGLVPKAAAQAKPSPTGPRGAAPVAKTPSAQAIKAVGYSDTYHWIRAGRPVDAEGKPVYRPI